MMAKRRSRKVLRTTLPVVLTALIAACVSDVQQSALERDLPRTQVALNAATDADSLAAAAELNDWPTSNSYPKRFALLARAAAAAPDRPDLVWLEIEACPHVDTCDPARLAETLHRLDPGNGAAWASLLDASSKRGDVTATNRYLTAIAESKRFDIYWNGSISHLTHAVLRVGTMDAATAMTALIGTEAAFPMPAYEDISKACQAPATKDIGRLSACRSIATVMRNGDTYLTEMIGIAIATRVWPGGSSEFAGAVAAQRVAEYRMSTQAALTSFNSNADAVRYLKLLTTQRTEQELALAVITAARQDPNPPADWKESSARWRPEEPGNPAP